MKFILLSLLIVLLVIIFNPFLPYWAVMILIALMAAVAGSKGVAAFFAGGLGMALAWLGQAIYLSSMYGSSLPQKMGELMGLGSEMALFVGTAVLGFLLGSFSALSGSLVPKLFKKKPDNIYGR